MSCALPLASSQDAAFVVSAFIASSRCHFCYPCRARDEPLGHRLARPLTTTEQASVFTSMVPLDQLRLKVGLPVMCIKNMAGITNGTMGKVARLKESDLATDMVSMFINNSVIH